MGLFFMDRWKLTPKLTMNIGLRWEMDTPMIDINNRMNGFDLEVGPSTPDVFEH